MLRFALMTILLAYGLTVSAQCSLSEVASVQQANNEYVVSGVLTRKDNFEVIKLTQSIVKTDNTSVALDVFTALVKKNYPEYKLLTSLIAPRSALLIYEPCDFDI